MTLWTQDPGPLLPLEQLGLVWLLSRVRRGEASVEFRIKVKEALTLRHVEGQGWHLGMKVSLNWVSWVPPLPP